MGESSTISVIYIHPTAGKGNIPIKRVVFCSSVFESLKRCRHQDFIDYHIYRRSRKYTLQCTNIHLFFNYQDKNSINYRYIATVIPHCPKTF